jgi:hypothetical protein
MGDPGVKDWAVTSTITRAVVSDQDGIILEHTKSGDWPDFTSDDGHKIEGNPWIVAHIGGKWYAGTYEWLKDNQEKKGVNIRKIGNYVKRPPMDGWAPRPGERIGLFVSTPARSSKPEERTIKERSQIVWKIWP